jgi:serine/threonine protein kinase/tetratricopeptide (TPR) repeat protein
MTSEGRERYAQLQALFHELVDADPEVRRRRVDVIRAEDPALADELEELLGDDADELVGREQALEQLAQGGGPVAEAPDPILGRVIGPFVVQRLLGEGGMGRVYEASQTEPIARQVALKVLRPQIASEEVLARFEGERQALAVMDHPNIARILDAGTTDDGTPWFAMELVDGVTITAWAEQQGLDLAACIELVLPVCDAVQHAHLKGVIHRDLKPSNILVARADDGTPVPKVIDFGVAKAIEQPLLARTLATRFGELVGTPEYMSPEQATLGALDVDTRSDVYSLGLVLYELLVGSLPLPPARLRGLAFDEICRRIREDDTPQPSVEVRRNLESGVVQMRPGTDRGWSRRVQAELDAVLLKALAKDRDRRYPSVADFADDLRRFLADEPVRAAPPSLAYRASKLVRRHKATAAVLASISLSIVVALVAVVFGWLESERARARVEAALATSDRTTDFLVELFTASDPRVAAGSEPTLRELLDRGIERIDDLEDEPSVQARLLETLGDVSWSLGLYEESEPLLLQALELRDTEAPNPARKAQALTRLGGLYRDRPDLAKAEEVLREAVATLDAAGLNETPEMGGVANDLGIVLSRMRRFEEAAEFLERSIELGERFEEAPSGNVASGMANLGVLYQRMGDPARSLEMTRRALALFEQILPENHPNFAVLEVNITTASRNLGDLGEARRAILRALEVDRVALPEGHPGIADDLHGLGSVELRLGRLDAARAAFTEGLGIMDAAFGEGNFRSTLHRASLGNVALVAGRPEDALEHLDAVLETLAVSDDPRAPRHSVGYLRQRALALRQLGRTDAARSSIERGLDLANETSQIAELPNLRLLEALLALDLGEFDRAQQLFDQATEQAGCTQESPCSLDLGDTGVLRAHWHSRAGDHDTALHTLGLAVDHTQWAAWMLDSPDLDATRQADSAAWQDLVDRLDTRRRQALGED